MNFAIRTLEEKDFPTIIELIKGLAIFVKSEAKMTNTITQMKAEKKFFRGLVVENKNREIVGMAIFYFAYSTWVGKTLYLDDLFVKKDYRGQKLGTQLLRKLFEIAKEEDCKRVRWQVLDWNKPAIEFYKKCGADIDGTVMNCDFDEKTIATFNI